MMTLPKFTNSNPSILELSNEQQRLQIQADKMLEQTELLVALVKFGELLPISGSYSYGLMVYPDIDLEVLCETINKVLFADIVAELVKNKWVRKVSTADNVNFESQHSGRPKGYWLGLEIPFENDRWGIDCWFQEKDSTDVKSDPYIIALSHISQEKRDAVLSIKYHLIYNGLYGKSYFSNDVYDAVLKNDITTWEEFMAVRSIKAS